MSPGQFARGGHRPAAEAKHGADELRVDMDALFGDASAPEPRKGSGTPVRRPAKSASNRPGPQQRPIRIYGAAVTVLVFVFAGLALWAKPDVVPPTNAPNASPQSSESRASQAPGTSMVEAPSAVEPVTRVPLATAAPNSPASEAPISPLMQMLLSPDRAPAARPVPPPAPAAFDARPAAVAVAPSPALPTGNAEAAPAPMSPAAAAVAAPAVAAPAVPAPAVALASPAVATVERTEPALRVIARPAPVYPAQAVRDQINGRVVARLTIGTDGSVSDVQIESASPPRIFDRAATAALRQWRYAPIATPQQTTVELDFKLEQ